MATPRGSSDGPDRSEAPRHVLPFMALALAALIAGLWAGLIRIGWPLPSPDGLLLRHGGLMVVGFVATVIGVERAVAVRSPLSLAPPAFNAASGAALLLDAPAPVAPVLATIAGATYVALIAGLLREHGTLPLRLMLVGGTCLTAAAVVWTLGQGMPRVVPWWIAFLALTIGAERLDLLRFQRATRTAATTGLAALALIASGPAVALVAVEVGVRLLAAGLMVGSGWLIVRDHPRRGIRMPGLPRYIAIGLLCAYGWLAFTGIALFAEGLTTGGWHYDAVVHAFFIGVVMSAILAHEPIVAPAILGMPIPFQRALYVPLVLLEGGLVARIAADAFALAAVRPWAGLVQVVAILLMLAIVVRSVLTARRGR